MGSELLHPYDCLRPSPALKPRRGRNPNPNSSRKLRPSPSPAKCGGDRRSMNPVARPSFSGGVGDELYAGSAFSLSPSPSSLPLPNFFTVNAGSGTEAVNYSATMDLRRLLRLD